MKWIDHQQIHGLQKTRHHYAVEDIRSVDARGWSLLNHTISISIYELVLMRGVGVFLITRLQSEFKDLVLMRGVGVCLITRFQSVF